MNDEPLTHDETVQLLRMLQNEVSNLKERVTALEQPQRHEIAPAYEVFTSTGGVSLPQETVSSPLA